MKGGVPEMRIWSILLSGSLRDNHATSPNTLGVAFNSNSIFVRKLLLSHVETLLITFFVFNCTFGQNDPNIIVNQRTGHGILYRIILDFKPMFHM